MTQNELSNPAPSPSIVHQQRHFCEENYKEKEAYFDLPLNCLLDLHTDTTGIVLCSCDVCNKNLSLAIPHHLALNTRVGVDRITLVEYFAVGRVQDHLQSLISDQSEDRKLIVC